MPVLRAGTKEASQRTVAEESKELFIHNLTTINHLDFIDKNASLSGE